MGFNKIKEFEDRIAEFYGAPYAVAIDCCTHGLELCLRYTNAHKIEVPKRTYISVPFLAEKLMIDLHWKDENWEDFYYISENIIDGAVFWKKDSYIKGTFMCISFQFRKHLSLGRGGVILVDNYGAYQDLKKMSYDGRIPDVPWREQDIDTMGYHYYMTPETAELGLSKLQEAIDTPPHKWTIEDWPDLTKMKIFNK